MTTEPLKALGVVSLADARASLRHVFVRDFVLPVSIGWHAHEKDVRQRVRFNLDLAVRESLEPLDDHLSNVVDYEEICDGVRALIERGHVNLVETLAEDVAEMCLRDPRVRSVRVKVEKLDIMPDAASVGVEIERFTTEL